MGCSLSKWEKGLKNGKMGDPRRCEERWRGGGEEEQRYRNVRVRSERNGVVGATGRRERI